MRGSTDLLEDNFQKTNTSLTKDMLLSDTLNQGTIYYNIENVWVFITGCILSISHSKLLP